jgi:hypothetical protein
MKATLNRTEWCEENVHDITKIRDNAWRTHEREEKSA